jgi:mannose-6-phosphate isomerase
MINETGKIYSKPWGTYQTLALAANYQIKIITVNPKGRLSLQKHAKRCEHWLVLSGNPTITIENKILTYNPNDYVFIPTGAIHRLENLSNTVPVTITEIQFGSYLGEDDIVRLDDIYGRVT